METYGGYVVMMIISFGTVTLCNASALAPLARWICGVITVFWLVRLLIGLFAFDTKPFLTNWFYRLGYHLLSVVFVYLVVVYGWINIGR